MIYDNQKNIAVYRSTLPGIRAAEDFLKRNDISTLPAGKIELGGGVCVNVNIYTPKDRAVSSWEAHRNFIDLQYVIAGDEDMACALMDDAADADEYNADKDYQLFGSAKRSVNMTFTPGDFALFFPNDVHMPGIRNEKTTGEVRKLVFKIPTPEYENTAHLKQLMAKIALPEDAVSAVLAAAEKMPRETICAITEDFFANRDTDAAIQALAENTGISVPLCSLTVYLLLAKTTYYHYLEKNIDSEVYDASMLDFTIWNAVCKKKTGAVGLLETAWLAVTLKEGLYRLGRLQFQPTVFEHDEYICGDRVIRRGDPVLTIHIPEGTPLTKEARMDAYRRAEKFFDSNVFVCESWLLYPAHRDFLQKGSRIVEFMDDFVLLNAHEIRGRLNDMWRIYGFSCDLADFAALPEDTGMQRAYKKHLIESGGMTGGGYGVIVFENGEIISK